MTLKVPGYREEMLPVAYIPDGWGNKGGILMCQDSNGGSFRTGYAVEELLALNPKELVMGYAENLKGDFFNWLTSQEQKYNSDAHGDYHWEEGDIPPVWFGKEYQMGDLSPENYLNPPENTRSEEDYLEIKAEPIRSPHHSSRRKTP